MGKLTITKRLVALMVCAILALVVVGAVGLTAAVTAKQQVVSIREDSIEGIRTIVNARYEFMRGRVNAYAAVLAKNPADMEIIEKQFKDAQTKLGRHLDRYEKDLSNADDRKMLEAERRDVSEYINAFWEKVLPLSKSGQSEKAMEVLREEMRPIAHKIAQDFDRHLEWNEEEAARYSEFAVDSVSGAIKLITATIGFSILLVSLLGYFIIMAIKGSLNTIRDGVGRIETDLDFTVRIAVLRDDEIGGTAQALNRLIEKIQANFRTLLSRTEAVAHSANQMASSSNQVATASHQQSEAASDMAATVEEMTVSINHVGDRAQEANDTSADSGRLATCGEAIIGQTMEKINKMSHTVNHSAHCIRELVSNSQQISSVAAVIKEVAEQTNLLALNAAIEAARAGEQGRGFAVVADEVRKLAERTASSAQEIARTIEIMRAGADEATASMENVVSEVKQGVESAREASRAIAQINVSSHRTGEMVDEISTAIREQASAMTSVAQQVERIAQMSEQSSIAAGNSARLADELDALSGEMKRIVSAYRLH